MWPVEWAEGDVTRLRASADDPEAFRAQYNQTPMGDLLSFLDGDDDPATVRADLEALGVDVDAAKARFAALLDKLEAQAIERATQ